MTTKNAIANEIAFQIEQGRNAQATCIYVKAVHLGSITPDDIPVQRHPETGRAELHSVHYMADSLKRFLKSCNVTMEQAISGDIAPASKELIVRNYATLLRSDMAAKGRFCKEVLPEGVRSVVESNKGKITSMARKGNTFGIVGASFV